MIRAQTGMKIPYQALEIGGNRPISVLGHRGPRRVREIKLQKGVDPTQGRPYMPAHRRGPAGFDWLCSFRSPTQNGRPVPRCKSGSHCCPPLALDGSLTLSVFDEGTCGRRRPVRGPQGSGNRLLMPTPHPVRAPRLRMDDACSFVSITFDSAGIGSLKLMPCGMAILRDRVCEVM